jgi:hypothetical protein
MEMFESKMENRIKNLLKRLATKEKRVELQEQLIKFHAEEVRKLKAKLYKKALHKLQQQSESESTIKRVK